MYFHDSNNIIKTNQSINLDRVNFVISRFLIWFYSKQARSVKSEGRIVITLEEPLIVMLDVFCGGFKSVLRGYL